MSIPQFLKLEKQLRKPAELPLDMQSASPPLAVDGNAILNARRLLKLLQKTEQPVPHYIYRTPIGAIKFVRESEKEVEYLTCKPSGKIHLVTLDHSGKVVFERQLILSGRKLKQSLKEYKDERSTRKRSTR